MVPQIDDRRGEASTLEATEVQHPTRPSSAWITGTVVYEQNRHDAMTIRDTATATNYHVVDYASVDLRQAMKRLGARERTVVRLSRTGRRGNVWCVEAMSGRPKCE